MKLLTFVDMHGDLSALMDIKKKAKKADMIVCAGDVSLFEADLDYLLYELNKIEKPVLIIPGNHEDSHTLKNICALLENINYIHKKIYEAGGFTFIGYGGGGFSLVEPEFAHFIQKNKNKIKGKKIVLVAHAPPSETKLDRLNSGHHGNRTIRQFIERYQPKLVVCGHFHENAGALDRIGKSAVLNPGPGGKIVEI